MLVAIFFDDLVTLPYTGQLGRIVELPRLRLDVLDAWIEQACVHESAWGVMVVSQACHRKLYTVLLEFSVLQQYWVLVIEHF